MSGCLTTTVTIDPPVIPWTSGEIITLVGEREESKTFPAGAYEIEIHNVDPALLSSITVNNEVKRYGSIWHEKTCNNEVEKTQDFLPIVNVVSTGSKYWFSVKYPSDSNVDLSGI